MRWGITIANYIAVFALESFKIADKISYKIPVNLKPLLFIGKVKRIAFLLTNCLRIFFVNSFCFHRRLASRLQNKIHNQIISYLAVVSKLATEG